MRVTKRSLKAMALSAVVGASLLALPSTGSAAPCLNGQFCVYSETGFLGFTAITSNNFIPNFTTAGGAWSFVYNHDRSWWNKSTASNYMCLYDGAGYVGRTIRIAPQNSVGSNVTHQNKAASLRFGPLCV